jgi:hypothetical protein
MLPFLLSTLIALDATPVDSNTIGANTPQILPFTNPIPSSFPANNTLSKNRLFNTDKLNHPLGEGKLIDIRVLTWGEFLELGDTTVFHTVKIDSNRLVYESTTISYGIVSEIPNHGDYIIRRAYDAQTGIELGSSAKPIL